MIIDSSLIKSSTVKIPFFAMPTGDYMPVGYAHLPGKAMRGEASFSMALFSVLSTFSQEVVYEN